MGKARFSSITAFILIFLFLWQDLAAVETVDNSGAHSSDSGAPWDKVDIGTLWYLSYGYGRDGGEKDHAARIGRGYLTLKFKPGEWFKPRITMDAHQVSEGDWKVRLKYLYGKFIYPGRLGFLTNPNVEFGLVHGPWFDYEEHINNYRMQGTMFIERNEVLNSADAGFTVGALLGGKLPKGYQRKVSPKYPGKYGSLAFGLYNGGGYHAKEMNTGKVFESRLSIRPLGLILPNLQVSHFLIHGEGNTATAPAWRLNALMISFEHEHLVLTAQYATGKGNQKGKKVDADDKSLDCEGYSGFAEIKLAKLNSSVIGRYDYWKWADVASTRLIAGYAYHLMKHNTLLFDLDRAKSSAPDQPVDWKVKFTLQVNVP